MLYIEQGEDHACTKLICHVDKTICLGNCFYFKQVVLEIVLSQTSCLGDRFILSEFLKLFLSQTSLLCQLQSTYDDNSLSE